MIDSRDRRRIPVSPFGDATAAKVMGSRAVSDERVMADIRDQPRITPSPFCEPIALDTADIREMENDQNVGKLDDRSRTSVSSFGEPIVLDTPDSKEAKKARDSADTEQFHNSVLSFKDSASRSPVEPEAKSIDLTIANDDIIMLDCPPSNGAADSTRATRDVRNFIDLTNDDEAEMAIRELTSGMAHIVATAADDSSTDQSSRGSSPRGEHINSRSSSPDVTEVVVGGIVYKAGMSLELVDGSFLRVQGVIPHPHNVRFFGRRLYRTTHPEAKTYLPKVHNELIWLTQNTDHVSLKSVKRIVSIAFTNFRTDFANIPSQEKGRLACRLKLTIRQSGVIIDDGHLPLTAEQCAIEWLNLSESDFGLGLPSHQLRHDWRGPTVPFGEAAVSSAALDLAQQGFIDFTTPSRAYTFGDAYCGGGGVSCGARQAGVKIKWAVDIDRHALETYQLNFRDVEVEHSDFFSFLTNDRDFLRVDIAHCSPPCQTWSPAHTVPCARDDANSACVFSAGSLIQEARPRVLTLEETMGLPQRFPVIFNRVVLDMVEFGYSVRWAVLGCDDYGVPQERKRLILIAAGPGEVLPHFAQPTHGSPEKGLLSRVTIASTIDNIPPDAEDHDVERALERWALSHHTAFDANGLARTITCGGGEFNYHPSGTRPYTCREMASLQTFPLSYRFTGKFMRKQVGNAVPPLFAKAIIGEIVRSLKESDAREANGNFH
ncbi:hypothetical protein N7461_007838 [Penicillium sp. DV-2018c]|nr:hypothetical protein N7461_007838 [Penicillium sp. DV-2018c]